VELYLHSPYMSWRRQGQFYILFLKRSNRPEKIIIQLDEWQKGEKVPGFKQTECCGILYRVLYRILYTGVIQDVIQGVVHAFLEKK
jgi:hypothetical protein